MSDDLLLDSQALQLLDHILQDDHDRLLVVLLRHVVSRQLDDPLLELLLVLEQLLHLLLLGLHLRVEALDRVVQLLLLDSQLLVLPLVFLILEDGVLQVYDQLLLLVVD